MIKIITIILCLNYTASYADFNSIDKNDINLNTTRDRFLYERYFKHFYKYEPSVIRENKIVNLEVKSNQKIGDSLISTKLKCKIEFRKDGRPKQMTEWFDYQSDYLISDYSYDSLGNLIECHVWSMTHNYRNNEKIRNDKTRYFFDYENGMINKVIHYDNNYDNRKLTLRSCDSLSFNLESQKLSIFHGNADKSIIVLASKPTFIYPIQPRIIEQFVFIEKNVIKKMVDKESLWRTDCKYLNPILIELQDLTDNQCLNIDIVNSCKGNLTFLSMETPVLVTKINYGEKGETFSNDVVFVDTVKQQIYIKQHSFMSEPTSLENRNTTTNSLKTYDYALHLIKIESIQESSRGQYESSKDSIETYFTYFNFDMLQKKVTKRYNQNLFNNWNINSNTGQENKKSKAFITEELTEIEVYK